MKTLNYVASLVQMDLDDYTTHRRMKIVQYCIDCYKSVLRYKTDHSVDVAYLTPNAVLNAPWPKDYEYYTKLAINVGNRLVTLTQNNNIPLVRKYDCGEEAMDQPDLNLTNVDPTLYTGCLYFAPHFRAGQYVGEMYSVGGGFNSLGYFREDVKNRQFQFSNIPNTEIVLEYVADSKTNANTLIYYGDVETIRTYAHWQLIEHDKKVSRADKDAKFWQHNAALSKRVFIVNGPNVSDYLDNCYKGIQSGVKR